MRQDARQRRADLYLPRVRDVFFYGSFLAGLAVMVALTTRQATSAVIPRAAVIDSLAFFLDPLIFHILGAVLVAWIFVDRYRRLSHRHAGYRIWFAALSGVAILLALELFLEARWLKDAFDYARPEAGESIPPSFLTGLLTRTVGTAEGVGGSCPSGFVWRQLWLLLFGSIYAAPLLSKNQESYPKDTTLRIRRWIVLLLVAMLLYVIFQRVYTRSHTLFDVGIAVGTGVYIFWLLYVVADRAVVTYQRSRFIDVVGMSLVVLPLFFFYSGEAVAWVYGGIVVVGGLGVIDFASGIIKGALERRRRAQRIPASEGGRQ